VTRCLPLWPCARTASSRRTACAPIMSTVPRARRRLPRLGTYSRCCGVDRSGDLGAVVAFGRGGSARRCGELRVVLRGAAGSRLPGLLRRVGRGGRPAHRARRRRRAGTGQVRIASCRAVAGGGGGPRCSSRVSPPSSRPCCSARWRWPMHWCAVSCCCSASTGWFTRVRPARRRGRRRGSGAVRRVSGRAGGGGCGQCVAASASAANQVGP